MDGLPVSAIHLSAAAGLVAVIGLYFLGGLKAGFVRQEDVAPIDFFTEWGHKIYDPEYAPDS